MMLNRHERRAARAQARQDMKIVKVHEAGHAVARYLTAATLGHNVEEAIDSIETHFDEMPTVSSDGKMLISKQATTWGPMYSRPMVDVLQSSLKNDTLEADVAQCIAAGVDVKKWAEAKAVICMSGPVAEAFYTKREVKTVMMSYECENDRRNAVRDCILAGLSRDEGSPIIDGAIEIAMNSFARPEVWRAVLTLADNLPSQGQLDGKRAAEIIKQAMS